MKKSLLLRSLVLFSFWGLYQGPNASAQQSHVRCQTTEHEQDLNTLNPKRFEQMMDNERLISKWIAEHPNAVRNQHSTISIPVVVHIVWNTAQQNITTAQVNSQIDVMNEDFSRTNADTVNTPAPFAAIAANVPYQFCLAQRDPLGNITDGIERRQTSVTSFSTNDDIKHYSSGGLDAWDVTQYFNIWVGPFGGGLLGYAEFPTPGLSNTYGVAIQWDAFGRNGSAASPYDLGRTVTHEVGHCLNLYHIWGDDGSGCTGSDSCADTPNQSAATYGCYTFPHTDACTPSGNGIMYMNYMDYSDDNCLNVFTENQASRMIASMNLFSPSLLTSNGCQPVVLVSDDAGIPAIVNPADGSASCDTVLTPIVTLKNWGSSALTAATINYQIDGGPANTFSWTGNLASLTSVDVALPAVSASGGFHSFVAYSSMPNGVPDVNNLNDTSSVGFTVNGGGGSPLPMSEGFESPSFPPPGFAVDDPDGAGTWELNTGSFHGGAQSAVMNNYSYNAPGQLDNLLLPSYDFGSVAFPQLTFWLAYADYYSAGLGALTDSLQISISTDCGSTWNVLFQDGGTTLNTTPSGTPISAAFTPTAADWEQFTIDLSAFASSGSGQIRFTNINDYGNWMFLDDINIDFSNGLQQLNAQAVSVYPNPSKDLLSVKTAELKGTSARLRIFNALGKQLHDQTVRLPLYQADVNIAPYDNGVYFLSITTDSGALRKSFVVQH